MNSNRKDIITGLVVILLIIGGVYLFKFLKKDKAITPTPSPASYEFKKDFSDSFKIDIPDDVSFIELKDISGGDSRGIATDSEILVDADDPESSYFYQAWLENNGNLKSLGKLKMAKGGWLLEFNETTTKGSTNVIVSLEKTFDNTLEKKILVGSF